MKSAWDEPVIVQGKNLSEGMYEVELTDIQKSEKVVLFREALRGTKGIIGKEYDSLDADSKNTVDNAPVDTWPDGRQKQTLSDRVSFVFTEPISGITFKYGAQFDMPSKRLNDFIARATGVTISAGEEIKFGQLFKPGDKFVAMIKRGQSGYMDIDPSTIMKKDLANPSVVGTALSERATKLLEYLKANYQGRPMKDIVDVYNSGMFGTFTETANAWNEIKAHMSTTRDGKTLDFSGT